jgi:FkbM family methyltransferase
MKQIIYDFGANNGDNVPYYLLKSDLVVAVEANPALCNGIASRFASEIASGRLVVENRVLTDEEGATEVSYFLHTTNHVQSQLPRPSPKVAAKFQEVLLPSASAVSIIEKHGPPHYVKIDIEHCDGRILRALFGAGIFPPFISAESHSIEVFSLLVSHGHYNAFKLVDGRSVARKYYNRAIRDGAREVRHSFPYHSAGPFGNDIDGKWMTANNFFRLLSVEDWDGRTFMRRTRKEQIQRCLFR